MREMTAPFAAALVIAAVSCLLAACGGDAKKSPFEKIDGTWHYAGTPVPGADAASFTPLDEHHARDRTRVYYARTYRDGREYFTVRHARILPVEGADPATFRSLGRDYARDARTIYHEGERMPVRDVATFELLDDGFARDRFTAYYYRAEIAGSEGGVAFVPLDLHHARDTKHVYFADIVGENGRAVPRVAALAGAEPASFKALERGYALDRTHVWYRGKAVGGADPATFAVLPVEPDRPDAEDARATYDDGERRAK